MQEFNPDLVVGISVYICTSMLSAKLGVPYVTVTPGKPAIAKHPRLHHVASYRDPVFRGRSFSLVHSVRSSLRIVALFLQP